MNRYILFIILSSIFAIDFSNDISEIIYTNCTSCHREGQIGSFLPLTNYSEIFENRFWIAYAIEGSQASRHGNPIMPPWPADRSYSALLDEMYLSDDEVHTFIEWIDLGAMQGDPLEEYQIPDFPEGSSIGVPDLSFQMSEVYSISGNYQDDYRCFIIEINNNEDIDIAALEFIPDNLEAVHHALIVSVPEGSADQLNDSDPNYGYECFGSFQLDNTSDILGGYAPGLVARKWPNGLAQKIPANSDLILQIHYAPIYEDQYDRSSINIFFKEDSVQRYIQEYQMINTEFALPPNQVTEVMQTFQVPNDISLVQFLPHAHLLGTFWEIYAVSSTTQDTMPIIRINDWDFDWQFFYSPEYMMHLPAGSVINARCIYDNTADNPDNPNNPPQWVFWGDGTGDEMFYVPFRYVSYQNGDENIYLGDNEILEGDLNLDGTVNVLDLVYIINIIILDQSIEVDCDFNEDGGVNILDVIILVNLIL
jgi:hypothetical protein